MLNIYIDFWKLCSPNEFVIQRESRPTVCDRKLLWNPVMFSISVLSTGDVSSHYLRFLEVCLCLCLCVCVCVCLFVRMLEMLCHRSHGDSGWCHACPFVLQVVAISSAVRIWLRARHSKCLLLNRGGSTVQKKKHCRDSSCVKTSSFKPSQRQLITYLQPY